MATVQPAAAAERSVTGRRLEMLVRAACDQWGDTDVATGWLMRRARFLGVTLSIKEAQRLIFAYQPARLEARKKR